ncbi:MAG: PilN domain-containing protein [Deltaproteobacteria bacterium]|nr:PilN domain-containing protein [Deltaproteobacteria bacterium]MBW1912365.1 PilN domain-containing protein [Deltaproteobacteria bacterium]
MIRINLLPFRAARKKENIKRQISIYVLTTMLLLVGMGYTFLDFNSELTKLKDEEKKIKGELATYEKTVKQINQLEKKIKEIKAKLTVIKTLEKGKTGPVHLLDEVAKAVPKEKLWLNSYRESKGKLQLSGTAMDNETVALFMTNLGKSEYITSVDLQNARLRNVKDIKLRVSDFVLTCKTYAHKEKPKPKKKGKKGRRR